MRRAEKGLFSFSQDLTNPPTAWALQPRDESGFL